MHDIIVIGAGPAGLAAATTAAAAGASVKLVDHAPRPGGQFWRHQPSDNGHRHRDWRTFQRMLDGLGLVDCAFATSVWCIEPGFTVHTSSGAIEASRVIIATGAYDRTFPFPGWDLPGVVTAGAAQALLKGEGVKIGNRVVVAGTGPFLLPVAVGLSVAGVSVAGVFEANQPLRYLQHGTSLPRLPEAIGYGIGLTRHRIGYHTRHRIVAAHGSDTLEAVTVASGSSTRRITCDALAVGCGFTPQVELAVALGCGTTLDSDGDLVVTEIGQRTTVPGVYVAGEVTGVGGAALAVIEGRLAGMVAADADTRGRSRLLRQRERLRRFAAAVTAVHPMPNIDCPDEVIVCRCETVTAATIRTAVESLGVVDTRGAKLMTRAGMGWCQGRVCGRTIASLAAQTLCRRVTAQDLRTFAHRPIAQPVSLSQLTDHEHQGIAGGG